MEMTKTSQTTVTGMMSKSTNFDVAMNWVLGLGFDWI
jgi:hypothetical protein